MKKAKKFLQNAILLTVTSILLRTTGVAFMVYISEKIGAKGMGIFQLISSVYVFAVTLATSGIGLATTRLVAEELAIGSHSGIKSAVKRCICYSAFFSVLSASLLFFGAPFIVEHWLHNRISAAPLYALSFSLPCLAMSSVLTGYFTAVRRVMKSASAQIAEQFIRIVVTVYLLGILAPKGLDFACLSLILGTVVAEILAFVYLFVLFLWDKRRYHKIGLRKDDTITQRMLSISLPVAISSYIRSGLNMYKQIMIPISLEKSGISCDAAIAQYGMIGGMVMPVLMFPASFLAALGSLLIPEIAESAIKNHTGRIDYIVSRIFKITLIFSICVSGVLFVYARDIALLIYNNTQVGIFIQMLSLLVPVMYFDDIVDAILKGMNEQVRVVRINIIDTLVSIVMLYTLLPLFGIKGYIAVIFVTEIFNAALSIGRLIQITGFTFEIAQWIVIPVCAIVASVIAARLLITVSLLLSIGFAVVLYLLVLWLLGVLTSADIRV